jgi:chemotaxis response regulator CheB
MVRAGFRTWRTGAWSACSKSANQRSRRRSHAGLVSEVRLGGRCPPVDNRACPARPMSQSGTNGFLIAALGASAGGLEAFERFFKPMPADAGIAFAVVQHLAPNHASALPELLARHTPMAVAQARDNTKIVPNRVYVIPPNATLTINERTLRVTEPAVPRGHRTPIDSLFSSLAEDCGENAVCIMLSGRVRTVPSACGRSKNMAEWPWPRPLTPRSTTRNSGVRSPPALSIM